ncbi:MAG: hypothetical protein KF867_04120 [Cryobacterium sp.]|nr:hypothetical protein [Cryobacterium sp.]
MNTHVVTLARVVDNAREPDSCSHIVWLMRLRIVSLFVAAVCLLGLTGCDPAPAIYSPAPAPSITPIFKSDEEALAAAKEAYERYLDVTDRILKNADSDIGELASVLGGKQLEVEIEGAKDFRSKAWSAVGEVILKGGTLQQYDRFATAGRAIVVAYICEDVSGVDVLDSSGKSVVDVNRPATTLYEVVFDWQVESASLRISDRQRWSDRPC